MRIFLLVIALVLCFQGDAFSADTSISVPTQAKVEQQGDLSLAVIVKLFGNTADFLIGSGNANVDGADGFFSGLIVSILGVLNFAAMFYVSAMIVYMWATFSVTTAHQGEKLGSGIYNSLWVPVRHGLSFGLVVPVINGLSIMQVGILLCIGIGINFANAVWNFSGNYLVQNINMQVQSHVYNSERENAYKLLPLMFKNAVVQDVLYDKLTMDKEKEIWEKSYSAYDPSAKNTAGKNNGYDPLNREGLAYQEYPIDYDGNVDENGRILRVDDYLNGRIILRPRDLSYVRFNFFDELMDSEKRANPAIIQIQMPKWSASFVKKSFYNPLQITDPVRKQYMEARTFADQSDALSLRESYVFTGDKNNAEFTRQKAFAEQKVKRLLAVWKTVNDAAEVYLHSYASANGSCAVAPCKYDKEYAGEYLGKEIASAISAYSKGISEDAAKAAKDYSSGNGNGAAKVRDMIRAAIDIKDGKSRFGWMSAGLFPFTLAFVQESINSAANNAVAGYNGTITNTVQQFREDLKKKFDGEKKSLNENYLAGIEKASDFYDTNIGRSSNFNAKYFSKTENTKSYIGLNDLKDALISAFAQRDDSLHESYAGVLGWTLDEVGKKDPILALYNFGIRLFDVAKVLVMGSLAVSILSNMTGWALVLSCLSLFLIGGFFAYVVPMIPLIYWVKALISWLFMCVESMVAAPFWVCAHALPEGNGFAGNHARRGYLMLLDIVARPVLLVIGAVFAVILAQLAGTFIYRMFSILFSSVLSIESISLFPDVIYSILVMSMVYYVFYMVFTRGVNYMPEHVINWCGGQAGGLRDEDDGTANILRAGGAMQQLKGLTQRITPGAAGMLVGGRR